MILAQAVARGTSLLVLPLLTLWLSPDAFGQAALASTIISLVSVVGLLGLDMSYARTFLSRATPNGRVAENFCWRFAIPASAVSGIIAAIAWFLQSSSASTASKDVTALVFFGASLSLLLAMAQTRARLRGSFRRLSASVAIGGVGASVVTLAIVWCGITDERALIVGYVAAYALPIAVLGLPSMGQLTAPSGLGKQDRRRILIIGLPGVVTTPIYWVLASSDRWFLQAHFDATIVGIFAIACTFGQLGQIVNSAILSIWLPEATRIHESEAPGSRQVLSVVMTRLIVLMAVVAIGIGSLSGEILRLIVADEFHAAAPLIPWLAAAVFMHGCYHLARTGLFLSLELKWSAWTALLGAAFSILGNALMVPQFGMLAAAVVQFVAMLLMALATLLAAQQKYLIPIKYYRIITIMVITVISIVLCNIIECQNAIERILLKSTIVAAAATLLFFLAVERGEWRRPGQV